jgi:uncharacterized phage-associated protein
MSVAVQLRATDIADYFVWLANDTGSFVSNLQLQKLVYYAQAWHLALYDRPLFEDDFQAWVHGPVIPELFDKYKHWQRAREELAPDDISANIIRKEWMKEYYKTRAEEV